MGPKLAAIGLGAAFFVGAAGAIVQAQTGAQRTAQMRADAAAQYARSVATPDTRGSGPFAAIKATDHAFPNHVIYRPADLSTLGDEKLPVLVWGNGGCSADGAGARLFLAEIASHGYLAIAPGKILSGPGAPPAPPPSTTGKLELGVSTTAQDVRDGIAQAARANAAAGRWHGRIDLSRVAVAGYSCGGLEALQVAGDPRIKAVIVMHSGIFADGSNPIKGMTVDKALLKTLHTPVLYMLGGPMDVAYPNGTDDVTRIDHVPVFLADHPVRHMGTFAQPNGGSEAKVVTAWLNWQLRGDAGAGGMFVGKQCGLCTDTEWTVTRKGID